MAEKRDEEVGEARHAALTVGAGVHPGGGGVGAGAGEGGAGAGAGAVAGEGGVPPTGA